MTTIRYTIDVPQEAIPELEQLMERHQTHFHPRRQITAINDVFMENSTAMGHHVPDLIQGMNRFLEQQGLEPRVPENHGEWEIPRIQEFLILAVNQFQWQDNEVAQAWWQEDGRTWEQVVKEHQEIFSSDEREG